MVNYCKFCVWALLSLKAVHAFCPTTTVNKPGIAIRMSDEPVEVPSDTVIEKEHDVVTVDSEDITTEPSQLVSNVMDLIPVSLGEVSESRRSDINEVLLKLETLNPTYEPALSPLLNGDWELKYSGGYANEGAIQSPTRQVALFLYSGGYSPGLFALSIAQSLPKSIVEVGDLKIQICESQPRVQASIDLKTLLGDSEVKVNASLVTESGIRLRETYESADAMGRSMELPEVFQYSRELFVTYLDDELLIVRDGSGVPEFLVRSSTSATTKLTE